MRQSERRKTCSTCKEDRPIWQFYADSRRADGHRGSCKYCERKTHDSLKLRSKLGLPSAVSMAVEIDLSFPWEEPWAHHAVEFVRRHPQTKMKWMHVPANGDWYSLTLHAEIEGVNVKMSGRGGWTRFQAQQLDGQIRAARSEEQESWTPAPFAYRSAA